MVGHDHISYPQYLGIFTIYTITSLNYGIVSTKIDIFIKCKSIP